MTIDKKEKLYINIVLVLFIAGIIFCFTLFPLLSETVSAEPLTDNSILNFNQLANYYTLNNDYYNFTKSNVGGYSYTISLKNQSVWWARITITSSVLDNSHKYYISQSNDKNLVLNYYNNSNSTPELIGSLLSGNSVIVSSANDLGISFDTSSASSFPLNFNLMLIDLTQTFGAGNEPTSVAEFKSYFISDYYAYTLSTLVPLDSTTSYSQGYTDGMTSFSIVTAADDIYNSSYYNGGEPTDTLVVNDTAPYFQKLVFQTQSDKPNVYLIFPMLNTIPANSNFSINGYINSYVYDTSGTLNIYAFINNKDYISLGSISFSGTTPKVFNLNVNVPFSVSNIAFISTSSMCVLGDVTITYKISNLQKLAQDNFNAGRDSVDIDSIKTQAFNKGKQAGIDSANKYTFSALVSSVVDAPIKAITGLLNFEIFGVNLKSFMLSLFTIAVVIAIVKLFLGNVGGSSAK